MVRFEDIEAAYQRRLLAHPDAWWGWSFMYTPEAALTHAKVVLIGLNPGGCYKNPRPSWEHDRVNAYVDQPWGKNETLNPLQEQVGMLFKALGVQPNEVFAANLVPFRSPSWSKLPDKQGALAFGRRVWTDLLTRTPALLFVSVGKLPGRELATLLQASFLRPHQVEWEPQRLDEYVAPDGRTVLAVPHLSRFRIFGGRRTCAARTVSDIAHRVLC